VSYKQYKLLLLFCFYGFIAKGQAVVVSEYVDAVSSNDEWTELLVIEDNTDLRKWTLRDNNSSQNSWQPEITFENISFWNHMRAGTVIVIWHRSVSTSINLDLDKSDGHIELHAQLPGYFSGGSFPNNTLNIAVGGDLIELRDSSDNHIHVLGHRSVPGSSFTPFIQHRLNHASPIINGDAVYVCPGSNLSEYDGGSGTTLTSKSNSLFSKGLPNVSISNPLTNQTYWRSIRQPAFPSATLTATYNGGTGAVSLNWSAATDPYPLDSTVGYLILRNTSPTFTDPVDSVSYLNGSNIGSATVLAQIYTSQTLNYTDNTIINCGSTYYYKVYAFRYFCTDSKIVNQSCGAINKARGRAYNETGTNVVSVSNPLPITNVITSY
jgi:hypothetical protein